MKKYLPTLLKSVVLFLASFSLLIIVSCGGNSDSGKTPGEKILEAIEGTWSVPTAGIPTDAAAVILNPTITFSTTTTSATFTTDGVSGLDDFVTGGSFSVAANGTVSAAVVNAGSSLTFTSPVITATTEEVTISFTASNARTEGVGTWTISVPIGN